VADQLRAAAWQSSERVVERLAEFAPCSSADNGADCAQRFISTFGPRVYRRALTAEEAAGLLDVYRAGETGGSYADGIGNVVRALLQSAGFLYLTEIGSAAAPAVGVVELSQDEIATSLSYLVTGAPPDVLLVEAAAKAELESAEVRETHARRLLATAPAELQMRRVIKEWLGIDRIEETAKSAASYPSFASLRPEIAKESDDFISAVIFRGTGTLRELFSAEQAVAEPALAAMYADQAVSRPGILNRAAFLSVYAHPHESAPVLRGVAVMRRLACLDVPSPSELNLVVVPPQPDPNKSTRERFSVHSADPECANCHQSIDAFGFSFEAFDGMGRSRGVDNGRSVDSTTTIAVGADFDGTYPSSRELAVAMAASTEVRTCFAEHLFRFAGARQEDAAQETFVKIWSALPETQRDSIIEALLAYVKSPLFTHRRGTL
jgi:hypothetical protein